MIRVFLIVMACMGPDFTTCQWLMAEEITGPDPMYWCLLNRPMAASMWQLRVNDGWRTFTRCELVNPEKNGRRG